LMSFCSRALTLEHSPSITKENEKVWKTLLFEICRDITSWEASLDPLDETTLVLRLTRHKTLQKEIE
jgi:hypothetical protein